mmetsp:Transcript_74633/g.216544  ORF Transcript_74633/g.216544 Transcript_74633/m.216544 type:complete len:369 (+) Transcript_74633:49-1155(+)
MSRCTSSTSGCLRANPRGRCSVRVPHALVTSEEGLGTELFFDAEKLVVLGQPLTAARGAGLDLAGAEADDEVRDERVFRLAGAVGDHHTPTSLLAHLARLDGLGDGPDLVDLQQERVAGGHVALHRLGDALWVRDEEVVADDLHALADVLGEWAVAVPVVLIEGVLDGDHGVLLDPTLVVLRELLRGHQRLALLLLVLPIQVVLLVLRDVELGRGDVSADLHLGLVARLLNGGHQDLQGLVTLEHIRGESAFVSDVRGILPVLLDDDLFQRVVHLGAGLQGLPEVLRAHGKNHELLARQAVAGVAPAVDDIEGRHRKDILVGRLPGELGHTLIERLVLASGRGSADRHADRQDGVRAELLLAPAPLVL